MRLGVRDQKVIRAFTERRAYDGDKLSTNGQRLDGHWLGGSRIAEWTRGQIVFNDLGSKAAESVHRQVRYHAAPNDLAETQRKVRARVGRDTQRRPTRSDARLYHVVVVNDRLGRKTRLTGWPVTQREGVVFMSKMVLRKDARYMLEEVRKRKRASRDVQPTSATFDTDLKQWGKLSRRTKDWFNTLDHRGETTRDSREAWAKLSSSEREAATRYLRASSR